MSEVNEQQLEQQETQTAPKKFDPFDDSSWQDNPEPPKKEVMPDVSQGTTTQPEESKEEYLDQDTYVKQFLGYDNVEAVKKELEEAKRLRENQQTSTEIKFANDDSKKYYEYITEGKRKELYQLLHKQEQLERLETMEVSKVTDAAEIIKANLQYKHSDLTPQEIDFLYNKRYSIPAKPTQGADQEDDDYAVQLEVWKQQVQEKEQEIIIEAKLAKPELSKYKSELVLPDIPRQAPQQPEVDQKLLENIEQQRKLAIKKITEEYTSFKGFDTKVKDESVELPISFIVPEEERNAVRDQLLNFDLNSFIDGRWLTSEGNLNVQQMMTDVYLLQNAEKVFQAIANNAAASRLAERIKSDANISLRDTSSQKTFNPSDKTIVQRQEEAIWEA